MPSLDQQIEMLAATGDQFLPEERRACRQPLAGVYLGDQQAQYDARIISKIPHIIVPRADVYRALCPVRPADALTTMYADMTVDTLMNSEELIIGFSGYGTGDGRNYREEREGIEQLFQHCASGELPVSSVVDGGTGYGIPGLSGALAQKYGLETVGFAPLRSLRGAAPRDTLAVVGEEFGDEAEVLGATPDVLLVFGGGPNAEKEVFASMAAGSLVIPVVLKHYKEDSAVHLAKRDKDVAKASIAGQFIVCEDITSVVSVLEAIDMDRIHKARKVRKRYLNTLWAA